MRRDTMRSRSSLNPQPIRKPGGAIRRAGRNVALAAVAAATVGGAGSNRAGADITVWGGVWIDPLFTFDEYTAQQFTEYGEPSRVLGEGFDVFGTHFCVAVSGDTLYSGNFFSVYQWDAATGDPIGPLDLDSPLSNHIENDLISIGVASNGDLLMVGAGFSTQLRTLTRYTADGTWIRDYASSDLMHTQGTPLATDDAVFIASRFNLTGSWDEQILMFEADGTYIGRFGTEMAGDVGDIEIDGDTLYAMNYTSGQIFEYQLNGTAIPSFIGTFDLPSNVNPDAFALDQFVVADGRIIVGDSNDLSWYEITRNGEVLGQFDAQTPPGAVWNFLGPIVIYGSGGGGGPLLSLSGNCPGTTRFEVSRATPNGRVAFAYGLQNGSTAVPPCPGLSLDFGGGKLVEVVTADASGSALLREFVPAAACGRAMVQAVDLESCTKTNVVVP